MKIVSGEIIFTEIMEPNGEGDKGSKSISSNDIKYIAEPDHTYQESRNFS